ncbi:MAG: DUF1552 domain-containing protein [Vicinamibacterales bacterium]
MIINKLALPRRTFLQGLGAGIALPMLDAMAPALSAAPTAIPRVGFFYVPNGMYLPNFHPKGNGGTSFEYTPILKPLEPLRSQVVVVSGLANLGVISPSEGGGVHTRAHGGWLSGVLPKRTEGSDLTAGKTIDQYAADVLGKDTSLRSLELTTEATFTVGNCENGYSCAYLNSTSWRTPNTPLPHERDPRVVFERLFGDGGSVSARLAAMRTDRSILDSVSASLSRLERRLGPGDRRTVADYLDAVRDIETRIQKAERNNESAPLPTVEQPSGIPDEYDEHARLLIDLLFLAYRADVTRVSCMQIARESSGRTYPHIGVPDGHHTVSHHQNEPYQIQQNTRINAYHVSLFAGLAERMRATPDGDGTLLDHAILLYGAGMGDGDHHTPVDLPVAIAGGGCGQMVSGRHVVVPENTPFMGLGVTLLEKVGVHVDRIADSKGPLAGI